MSITTKIVVAAVMAFVIVQVAQYMSKPQPTAAQRFGCSKTYVNAQGEDTGECE